MRVVYRNSVEKDLRKISKESLEGIVRKIQSLAGNPRPAGVVKLSGGQQLYRLRHGDFRIIYEIRDNEVLVIIVKVGHRRDVYK